MTATPPSTNQGDLFLARRAAAGHAAAWDQLLERYGRRIWGVALQFAPDRSQAEDLCQQIFHRLYQRLGFQAYGIEPRGLKAGDRYFDQELLVLRLDDKPLG